MSYDHPVWPSHQSQDQSDYMGNSFVKPAPAPLHRRGHVERLFTYSGLLLNLAHVCTSGVAADVYAQGLSLSLGHQVGLKGVLQGALHGVKSFHMNSGRGTKVQEWSGVVSAEV